jgi:hypothetical protein
MRLVRIVFTALVALVTLTAGCGGGRPSMPATGVLPGSGGAGAGGPGGRPKVPDAGGSARLCSDLFDQTILPTFAIEISADDWAKLDADFHDVTDVLAGTPPQTEYPIVFKYGAEVASNATVRLRGKSSWVNTVQLDANPKMQFVVSFDKVDAKGTFHDVSSLHFEMPRDDWTFMNDRIGNNWLRKIGITAPCANNAKLLVNGSYYGLYVAEGTVNASLVNEFFPMNRGGDLLKGGTEVQSNVGATNWARVGQLRAAVDIGGLAPLVDLPNTVLEWAAEAVVDDADGYYGGAHNYYIYDEGAPGYVWLPDHTDSALEWLALFTSLSYKQHPIYWWAGRALAEPPASDYLIVLDDPTWRARYTDAIATQLAKWDESEILAWIDAWSAQITGAVAADPHRWATPEQFTQALAALRDVVVNRPKYLRSFVSCERGLAADSADQDQDGVPWCNDCDDNAAAVHPGAPEVCNGIDDNCDGRVDERCPSPVDGGAAPPDGGGR